MPQKLLEKLKSTRLVKFLTAPNMGMASAAEDPQETLHRMRLRVIGGACPPTDTLNAGELAAVGTMISKGEAKYSSLNCRLIVVSKVDNKIKP